jgi:hypothetical protein
MGKLDTHLEASWKGCPECLRWVARECQAEILEIKATIRPYLSQMNELAQARVVLEWRAYNSEQVRLREKRGTSLLDPRGCPEDRKGAWGAPPRSSNQPSLKSLGLNQSEIDGLDL